MKCPHPIEPHQIQGLDFIHMYPVVQVAYNIPKCHKTGGLKTFALMIDPKKLLEKNPHNSNSIAMNPKPSSKADILCSGW